ncbi:hypothetical protein EGH24_10075 [Halonotius terrestris]|uniref:Uncharacterized protein n=1 Tax=Halonotius terrestris TaxID=2487750 RepID=A0A8J8PAT7_9EURY|nr:hypothetical protein [Halonotius terrestris]TQQ79830.1 hypothetical protein EGH24_10075 [Halonotius terrestris]
MVGASGAFTSVSADREISVESSGDADANVQIVVNEQQGLTDSGEDVIGLSFSGLNQNAVTRFNNALTITPQGGNGPYDVSIEEDLGPVSFEVVDGTNVSGGTAVNVNVVIDLTGEASAEDIPTDATITISVTQSA